jgi:hypothetical protein
MSWNTQALRDNFVIHDENAVSRIPLGRLSTKLARQSTKGRPEVVDLCRGERDQERDSNRDTRHKIYTGSGCQRDVKPYVMCSVVLY